MLGVKAGAKVETMAKIISVSTGASWQLSNQFPLRAFNGSFQPGFMTNLLYKDLGLALDLASEYKAPAPPTALTRQMYQMFRAAGYGSDDYTSVLKCWKDGRGGSQSRMNKSHLDFPQGTLGKIGVALLDSTLTL